MGDVPQKKQHITVFVDKTDFFIDKGLPYSFFMLKLSAIILYEDFWPVSRCSNVGGNNNAQVNISPQSNPSSKSADFEVIRALRPLA